MVLLFSDPLSSSSSLLSPDINLSRPNFFSLKFNYLGSSRPVSFMCSSIKAIYIIYKLMSKQATPVGYIEG